MGSGLRACPGVHGRPCPRYAHLRKDSKGGLCITCRKALVFDGLVDAAPARKHLRKLSRRKVGYKQAADSACVSITVVARILSGEKAQIRASTSRKILEVARVGGTSDADQSRSSRMTRKLTARASTRTAWAGVPENTLVEISVMLPSSH